MRRLRHTVEQILAKLREAEIALSKREQPKRPVYKTLSDRVREVVGKEHPEANQTVVRKSDGWGTGLVVGAAV